MTEKERQRRREYTESLAERVTTRRGDRVLAERLLRRIRLHLETVHPYRTLQEIQRLSPADYELYREALE